MINIENTANLNLAVISTSDDIGVIDFFQQIAGEGVDSNFEILDAAIGALQSEPPKHVHSVADIEDFPESLPADGGDADTVGGKLPSYFATSGHTHPSMTGATSSSSGKAGFVPAPTAANRTAFLRGDGTWATPEGKNYTAGTGISISSDNKINNTGVLSVKAGTANGSISVDGNDIPVTGLGSAAFTDSNAYAASEHTHNYAGSSTPGGKANSAKIADEATKAAQDASGNAIISTYETKADSINKLDEAKRYADGIKDDLLNGAGEAYDTLKELGNLIDVNTDAIEALNQVAVGKQDKITGMAGDFVVIGSDGKATTKTVYSFEEASF